MIIGRELIENQYESERLYSTGDSELDDLLERAFCEGYEYAQKEFGFKEWIKGETPDDLVRVASRTTKRMLKKAPSIIKDGDIDLEKLQNLAEKEAKRSKNINRAAKVGMLAVPVAAVGSGIAIHKALKKKKKEAENKEKENNKKEK